MRSGVSIGNDSSVTRRLVSSSMQASHALRVLRTHGLDDVALHHVYCAKVIARLTYAASAWRVLTRLSYLLRINSVIDLAGRRGYCPAKLPSFEELCATADDKLFRIIVVLHQPLHRRIITSEEDAPIHYSFLYSPHPTQRTVHFSWVCSTKIHIDTASSLK